MTDQSSKPREYDIAIAGSGFSGSLLAMIARRLGLSVVLIERGHHPRFAIGESSTPLSNLLLETIADRFNLPNLKPLTKWGTWQKIYPQIACGLKRGFSFFHHPLINKAASPNPPNYDDHLLVAASPNDTIADTHWFRADFDQLLLKQARDLGADYLDHTTLHSAEQTQTGWHLQATQPNRPDEPNAPNAPNAPSAPSAPSRIEIQARLLIDATGPRGLLHKLLSLKESPLPNYPTTSTLYTHFAGVADLSGPHPPESPYPVDAAALHHVFEGGWIWILRFNNGLTSAGVAATEKFAQSLNLAKGEPAWHRLLDLLPAVKQQFAHATPTRPFTYAPKLSFRSQTIAGKNWALLPSAAGFVDPLLSTGFPLTLLGVLRLGEILARDLPPKTTPTHQKPTPKSSFESNVELDVESNVKSNVDRSPESNLETSLQTYATQTEGELLATASLLAALYRNLNDFPLFRSLTLLYFAAASYAETARRLDKPSLAPSFLLHTHPLFGPETRRIAEAAAAPNLTPTEKQTLEQDIYTLIEPFDVAGLTRRPANHCYPVEAADLFAAAHKLNATPAEIERLLERAGFYATSRQ